jgi:hypothetical protein
MPFVKTLLFVAAIIVYVSLSHVALMVQDAQSIWRQIAVVMLVVPIIGIAGWGIAAALKQVTKNAMVRLVAGLTVDAAGAAGLDLSDSAHRLQFNVVLVFCADAAGGTHTHHHYFGAHNTP